MVQELCADIKKLDCAKTHLQMSITSLNRLQMLMNAVGQLEVRVSCIYGICLREMLSFPMSIATSR
jgi:hypothetical protein